MNTKRTIERLKTYGSVFVVWHAAAAIAMAASNELGSEVTSTRTQGGEFVKLSYKKSPKALSRNEEIAKREALNLCAMFGYQVRQWPHYIQVKKDVYSKSYRTWQEVAIAIKRDMDTVM